MSIKTKMRLNAYFFIAIAVMAISNEYSASVIEYVNGLIPVVTVP